MELYSGATVLSYLEEGEESEKKGTSFCPVLGGLQAGCDARQNEG